MTLNYHFKVEQEAGSSIYEFFGFNGSYYHSSPVQLFSKELPGEKKLPGEKIGDVSCADVGIPLSKGIG